MASRNSFTLSRKLLYTVSGILIAFLIGLFAYINWGISADQVIPEPPFDEAEIMDDRAPAFSLKAGWNMLSHPGAYQSQVADGNYYQPYENAYQYNSTSQKYETLTQLGHITNPGEGFFLYAPEENSSFSLKNTAGFTPTEPTKPFAINLNKGWNLIGNPFNADFDKINEIDFSQGVADKKSVKKYSASRQNKDLTSFYSWDSQANQWVKINDQENSVLLKQTGYFIYSVLPGTLTLPAIGQVIDDGTMLEAEVNNVRFYYNADDGVYYDTQAKYKPDPNKFICTQAIVDLGGQTFGAVYQGNKGELTIKEGTSPDGCMSTLMVVAGTFTHSSGNNSSAGVGGDKANVLDEKYYYNPHKKIFETGPNSVFLTIYSYMPFFKRVCNNENPIYHNFSGSIPVERAGQQGRLIIDKATINPNCKWVINISNARFEPNSE